MRGYEFIEHTADIGIRVKGRNLKELFKNAASAMFDIIAEKNPQVKTRRFKKIHVIKQKAGDLDELFVNWLNELLSLSAVKGEIFSELKFRELNKHSLEAIAGGNSSKSYRINKEIKAATYHGLKIKNTASGWQAEVIFDV